MEHSVVITVEEVARRLGLETLCRGKSDASVSCVYTSDLLSDVLANAPQYCILVTVQAHLNTAAVAAAKEIPAVIVCNSRPVPEAMKSACEKKGIALFSTMLCQYEVSGRLYQLLNP